ncbi:MAG: hypothetical protein WBB25_11455 [Sulfitobacter sp.]
METSLWHINGMEIRYKERCQGFSLVLVSVFLVAAPLAVKSLGQPAVPASFIVLTVPWADPAPDIIAAGGSPLGPQRALFGMLATADEPDFAARLGINGFWVLKNSGFSRFLCGELS